MFNISGSEHPDLLRVYKKAVKIYDDGLIFKKRKKRERLYRYLRRISLAVVALSVFGILYLSIHFFSIRIIVSESIQGKNNIDQALTLLEANENEAALYYSKLAQNNFSTANDYLHEYKKSRLINGLPYLEKQYSDLDYLFSTANILSQGTEKTAELKINLNKIIAENSLSDENKTTESLLKFCYESAPELFGIKANLDLAYDYFANIKYQGILRYFKPQILQIGDRIKFASQVLDKQIPLSQILPSFLGYPESSRYLVIVQDSRQIMPTGGKMVAYGLWENKNGKITNLNIQPINKMTIPIEQSIAAPLALRNYLHQEKWGAEYANWGPDWPQTAQNIEKFYRRSSHDQGKIDGVIAINNDFFKQLLNVSGPIKVADVWYDADNYNQAFDSENGVIAMPGIISQAKEKLFTGGQSQIFNSLMFLSVGLAKKNILLYFNDPNFEQISTEKNWSGQIAITNSDEDYLAIFDSNISGNKNEKSISKNINYSLDQDVNGAFVELKINYANQSIPRDQVYKNYLRIYVPLGAELIDVQGFDNDEVSIDADPEKGKSIFSGLITLDAAKMANIKLYYKLPKEINEKIVAGDYWLYTQKQAGNEVGMFMVDLKFMNGIKLYNPTGLGADLLNPNEVRWQTNYLSDRLFYVNLN